MHGDSGRSDFGWWAHSAIYVIKMCAENLHDPINQCRPSNLIKTGKTP